MGLFNALGGQDAVDAFIEKISQPGYKFTKNDIGRMVLLYTLGDTYVKVYDLAWSIYFKTRFPKQILFTCGTYKERIDAAKRCAKLIEEEEHERATRRSIEKIRRIHEKMAMKREELAQREERKLREQEAHLESLGGILLY